MFTISNYKSEVTLKFVIQPIVLPGLQSLYGFECLSELLFDKKEFCKSKEDFFSNLNDEDIERIIMAQVKYLNTYVDFFVRYRAIVSINVPSSLILKEDFLESVIKKAKFRLAFEVTDLKELKKNRALIMQKMKQINDLGIEFWLDDYHPEDMNFENIREFPWQAIKLDKTLLVTRENIGEILRFLRTNSEGHLKNIIIEGIESQDTHTFISMHNIKAQGYYYGRPKSVNHYLDKFSLAKERLFLPSVY